MLFPLEDSIFYILCSLVLLKQQKLVTVSKSSYSGMSLFSFWSLVHALSSGEAGEAEMGEKNPPPTCCSSVHLTWMSALGCGQLGIAHLMGICMPQPKLT